MTSLVYVKFTAFLGSCKDMESFVGEGCILFIVGINNKNTESAYEIILHLSEDIVMHQL